MGHIQIRTGNGLRARLATTVSYENLFTELVKNSLQNNATQVKITYNNNQVVVLDNGDGFDNVKDDTGLNEFEKYFVFGNSYTKANKHLNLGQMGVGGKAANDKLSDFNNTHWSIYTKNKRNKSFELTFKSSDEKYLHDIKPNLRDIGANQTGIPFRTGARIVIHNVNPELIEHGWPDKEIKDNLQMFFNMLFFQTKDTGKPFRLWVNNQEIRFNNNLPGNPWKHQRIHFEYKLDGKTHKTWYELKLNKIDPGTNSLLNCVDLVSYTRIGPFGLNAGIINQTLDMTRWQYTNEHEAGGWWNQHIRGYIMCPALSDVKDRTDMSAKDLSHHRLHPNHPVTKPFLESVHRSVVPGILNHLNHRSDPMVAVHNTLNHVSGVIFKTFNVPDEFIIRERNTITEKKIITK